jgi:hypothetical protein
MTILEEALKVERDALKEQEINLRRKLISAWEQSRYVDHRLWIVSSLLGQMRKEVA